MVSLPLRTSPIPSRSGGAALAQPPRRITPGHLVQVYLLLRCSLGNCLSGDHAKAVNSSPFEVAAIAFHRSSLSFSSIGADGTGSWPDHHNVLLILGYPGHCVSATPRPAVSQVVLRRIKGLGLVAGDTPKMTPKLPDNVVVKLLYHGAPPFSTTSAKASFIWTQ